MVYCLYDSGFQSLVSRPVGKNRPRKHHCGKHWYRMCALFHFQPDTLCATPSETCFHICTGYRLFYLLYMYIPLDSSVLPIQYYVCMSTRWTKWFKKVANCHSSWYKMSIMRLSLINDGKCQLDQILGTFKHSHPPASPAEWSMHSVTVKDSRGPWSAFTRLNPIITSRHGCSRHSDFHFYSCLW